MSGVEVFFFVPMVIFLGLLAPIWIVAHYRTKARAASGLTNRERAELNEMIEVANKMAERIETLEAILDVESPGWRDKQSNVG